MRIRSINFAGEVVGLGFGIGFGRNDRTIRIFLQLWKWYWNWVIKPFGQFKEGKA